MSQWDFIESLYLERTEREREGEHYWRAGEGLLLRFIPPLYNTAAEIFFCAHTHTTRESMSESLLAHGLSPSFSPFNAPALSDYCIYIQTEY